MTESQISLRNTYDPKQRAVRYVVFDPLFIEEWNEWWNTTSWRKSNLEQFINFDKTGLKSSAWEFMRPCARYHDGLPSIQCIRCETILIHPHIKDSGTSTFTRHLNTKDCQKQAKQKGNLDITPFTVKKKNSESVILGNIRGFSQEKFDEQTTKMIIALRLPFRSLENIELKKWIHMASYALSPPKLLTSPQLRASLDTQVEIARQSVLARLPQGAMISTALDCWQSPNKLAFMAVTGYFIDRDWNYTEVLLGFEHLKDIHSGRNLATTFLDTLHSCNISEDRVLTITSDNAFNNEALVRHVTTALDHLNSHIGRISRVPCLSHVIQLALKEVVVYIKIKPRNNKIITDWNDDDENREKHSDGTQTDGVPWTLKKVRDLAIYVNASAQRRARFAEIQTERRQSLVLIQDVSTRWNSTFYMLVRARRLKDNITEYIERENDRVESLTTEEWKHIDYLIEILYPFCVFTNAIGATGNGPTIQDVFKIYDRLFTHLENQIYKLQNKRLPWKITLRTALIKGRQKLQEYYSKTKGNLGNIYGVATILAPEYKMSMFETEEWQDDEEGNWYEIYKQKLYDLIHSYDRQRRSSNNTTTSLLLSQTSLPSTSQDLLTLNDSRLRSQPLISSLKRKAPDLETLLGKKRKPLQDSEQGELTQYLSNHTSFGINEGNILQFWKRAEQTWPTLALIARDYLAIPAASVGVERLFNQARDICSYRRHHLKASTIRSLMILMYHDRSTLREEHRSIAAATEFEDKADEDKELDVEEDFEDLEGLISDEEIETQHNDEESEEEDEEIRPENFMSRRTRQTISSRLPSSQGRPANRPKGLSNISSGAQRRLEILGDRSR